VSWFGSNEKPCSSDSQSCPDEALILRLKQRQSSAFLELYERYGSTIYRYLMHMTGSITLAEELTQEVFVVILDAMTTPHPLGSFDPARGTLEGYLLGIARNLARMERRRNQRLESFDELSEHMDWSKLFGNISSTASSWDYISALSTRNELRLLQRYILELPEHYRAVVVLCVLQEKSYRDAAAILKCPANTIASRLSRAKALLSAKLQMTRRTGAANRTKEGGTRATA